MPKLQAYLNAQLRLNRGRLANRLNRSQHMPPHHLNKFLLYVYILYNSLAWRSFMVQEVNPRDERFASPTSSSEISDEMAAERQDAGSAPRRRPREEWREE